MKLELLGSSTNEVLGVAIDKARREFREMETMDILYGLINSPGVAKGFLLSYGITLDSIEHGKLGPIKREDK